MAFSNPLDLRMSIVLGGLAVWIAICRSLRFARRDSQHAKFPYKTREDFKNMTNEDAWQILKYCTSLEFPFVAQKSLEFALFRTYGIPTISKLLVETKQFSDVEYAGRRMADTGILITEWLAFSPSSERANAAIARMNYLHSMYQKSGKISNDDMIYTLALFALEPEAWIRKYEWRSLTPMEICAFGTFYKSMGEAMGIDWSPLSHGPDSFTDGLEFFDDIRIWAEEYEKNTMVPAQTNHQTANETTAILLYNLPGFLKPFGRHVVSALMGDRLRKAMIYPPPPSSFPPLLNTIFTLRKLTLLYLLPPRPTSLPFARITETPSPSGRHHQLDGTYDFEPWYVAPTFWARNRPAAWYKWAMGMPYPGSAEWKGDGYLTFEVGPKRLEGKGAERCAEVRDQLLAGGRGGCPFGGKV